MNTFGKLFTVTTFGESHGAAIGGVVDGMPPGIDVDLDFIQQELNRRRPGQSKITTSRQEGDRVELLSGIFEGKSTGCPIGFVVRNENQHSQDYENLRTTYRPSHADYTYQQKYGIRDHRGGGRSSARITISRVVAGALAKLVLRRYGITIQAYTSQVGDICLDRDYRKYDLSLTEQNAVRCPDPEKAALMEQLISEVKAEGDTIGGVITCVIKGCPVGIGEPEFDKLNAVLGAAMLGINAVKGFEVGDGFAFATKRGSEVNDLFVSSQSAASCANSEASCANSATHGTPPEAPEISAAPLPPEAPVAPEAPLFPAAPVAPLPPLHTLTNHSGGIQGGISNGEDICFRVAFKPVATLLRPQETVDMEGNPTTLTARGRHDPCVLPRAVPVVEAMAAITILDLLLQMRSKQ